MPDPITRLNAALEGRYAIERELGEGAGAQARAVHSGSCFLACLGMAVCILSGCAPVQHGDAAPRISVEKSTYAPGENIVVAYSNGPGNITDWIAIYVDGENTEGGDSDPNLKVWYYTNGTHAAGEKGASNGHVAFDSGAENEGNGVPDWPLPEGEYDIYLICCDGL